LPGEDRPLTDPDAMRERLGRQVDLIIDGGNCGLEPTTVLDLVDGAPLVVRRGKGDVSALQQ
ncbi:MAG: Sua5/YciO/YrdC/YwlC family protein, partial [Nitrososphaera sp.]